MEAYISDSFWSVQRNNWSRNTLKKEVEMCMYGLPEWFLLLFLVAVLFKVLLGDLLLQMVLWSVTFAHNKQPSSEKTQFWNRLGLLSDKRAISNLMLELA